MSFSLQTSKLSFTGVYRETSGAFSGNLASSTTYDYFDDSALVGDCLYFYKERYSGMTDFNFNVGTPIAATNIELIWEYYSLKGDVWIPVEDVQDDTNGFTTVGENFVRFPLQWEPGRTEVNGITYKYWIRCRIVSVTGLTEGGANTTVVPSFRYGYVNVYGTTEEIPASFEELYQWLLTTYPHISVQKVGSNTYDFTKIGVYITSPLLTKNEVILLGQNTVRSSETQTRNYFSYLISGTKKDGRGYDGSTFIIYGSGNSSVAMFSQTTKLYGTTFRTGPDQIIMPQLPGYANMFGETLDCWLELAIRPPTANYPDGIMSNTTVVNSLMIASGMYNFNNISIIQIGVRVFYCYVTGWKTRGLAIIKAYAGNTHIFYPYQAGGGMSPEWVLLDPEFDVPTTTGIDGLYPAYIGRWTAQDITSVKLYNSSGYSDLTAEAQSTTIDDVPLSGEVGDYYLFGLGTAYHIQGYSYGMYFTISSQSNDYEYVYEYWDGSDWLSIEDEYLWDSTENFTKTGYLFLGVPLTLPNSEIDGTTAKWARARIISKGAGSPVCSRIQQKRVSGGSNWQVIEKYSFNMKVTDADGEIIVGASVTATDENGSEIFDVLTGIDGTIEEQEVTAKRFFFDPSISSMVGQELLTVFDVMVNKNMYQSSEMKNLDVYGKKEMVIALESSVVIADPTPVFKRAEVGGGYCE